MKKVGFGTKRTEAPAIVIGCMRLAEILKACEIRLTREEWYTLYLAAGHPLP
ncbi:MAG: hypothetical protein MJ117_07740 [Lachnospiraceae bacterium]|nr:hypothetical protein [Lachnospiraceae bacterium]